MFALRIEPGVVLSWDEFRASRPGYAIAMDGFVSGPPAFDVDGPWVNLNHHEGVNRLATRATCEQVLVSIRMGLLESFEVDGRPCGTLYVNDVDEDICLSTWLFRHFRQLDSSRSEHIHRLVFLEGLLDTTAGAYPLPLDSPELTELAWVFKPFHDLFRDRSRDASRFGAHERSDIVEAVGLHISRYVRGKAGRVELDTRYEVVGGGEGWSLVREQGVHARTAMRAHGIQAFLAIRNRDDGNRDYTIARMSPYVPFPVQELYGYLNEAEGIPPEASDRWDGGDTVGGSPRKAGSSLSPEALTEAIEDALKRVKVRGWQLVGEGI